MKNRVSFYLLYGMTVLLGGLGLLLLIFGQKTPHASERENRMLAGFPELSVSAVRDGSFMSGIESYLSDNVPDRDGIIEKTDLVLGRFSLAEAEDPDDALYREIEALAQQTPAPADTFSPAPTAEPETPVPTPAKDAEETPQPAPTAEPVEAPATEKKDLSDVPECTFTLTEKSGEKKLQYTFPKENVQKAIRLFNAYRALLPADGHVFFAQPPFPGLAGFLSRGECTGWDGDLEDVINAYADDGVYAVSVPKLLEQPLLSGEDMYLTTDHHWTPHAACYTANACVKQLGIDPRPYEDFSHRVITDFYGSASSSPGYRSKHAPDVVDLLVPSTPVKGYRVFGDRSEREAPLICDEHSYKAFLGGTLGPWRRFETGVDCGRSCLVIGDSYSNVFVPYLTPYYETVHCMDPRQGYFDFAHAGWTISEYIAEHGIDDVYFVLSTASGVNSVGLIGNLLRYL
jgi:hypothetical protein